MNYNLISYALYLGFTFYIIFVVGKICYRNGNVFVLELIPDHAKLCQHINTLLLMGYYLINIGYACIALINWPQVQDCEHMISMIGSKTSVIVAILALLHYTNIFILTNYIHKLIR